MHMKDISYDQSWYHYEWATSVEFLEIVKTKNKN